MFPHSLLDYTRGFYLWLSIRLGIFKGGEYKSISSGSHEVSATELSRGEGAQQWDAHLQVRDRPPPRDIGVQHPLKLQPQHWSLSAVFVTAHYAAGMWKPGDLSQGDRQKSSYTKEGRKCCTLQKRNN